MLVNDVTQNGNICPFVWNGDRSVTLKSLVSEVILFSGHKNKI